MSAPLERLTTQHGFPLLDEKSVDDFLSGHEFSVLFFTEDPVRYPASNDVAVILPELVKAFAGQFAVAVVDRSAERALQANYGFSAWPALVFFSRGKYLGAITRVRNWGDYIADIRRILATKPSQPPVTGMPAAEQTKAGARV